MFEAMPMVGYESWAQCPVHASKITQAWCQELHMLGKGMGIRLSNNMEHEGVFPYSLVGQNHQRATTWGIPEVKSQELNIIAEYFFTKTSCIKIFNFRS